MAAPLNLTSKLVTCLIRSSTAIPFSKPSLYNTCTYQALPPLLKMANEQSNKSRSNDANHIVDGITTLSVNSPDTVSANQTASNQSADSALSLVHKMEDPAPTSSIPSPPSRPLWGTREGRIAGFKRMIEKNRVPDLRANLEALVQYYEEGGKVPEGDEEVWAVEGQASFGIRKFTSFDQMPEGWLFKLKYCDVSNSSPNPISYSFIANSVFVFLLELKAISTQP